MRACRRIAGPRLHAQSSRNGAASRSTRRQRRSRRPSSDGTSRVTSNADGPHRSARSSGRDQDAEEVQTARQAQLITVQERQKRSRTPCAADHSGAACVVDRPHAVGLGKDGGRACAMKDASQAAVSGSGRTADSVNRYPRDRAFIVPIIQCEVLPGLQVKLSRQGAGFESSHRARRRNCDDSVSRGWQVLRTRPPRPRKK